MNRDEELYAAALALPASERTAFLLKECAGDAALRTRVEALLAANDEADAFFDVVAVTRPCEPVQEKAGDRIGRYKLLQKIGEGGCGVVYMADQEEPVRRRVALKVIKLGMDTKAVIARFEAERQALALMEHPNIARVLDAGATETGRPFFVMELVRGIPFTRYCDEENLSTEERLQLFMQVCHAIQHAHHKGIVHRDIKPSNILVTMHDDVATPKVIDFGIAKATQGRLTDQTVFTAFEQFIGTPAYMSPEQAQFNDTEVDTRSDIYSLGVLLYELLTGRPPFDPKALQQSGIDEIRRIIREVEPPRPSVSFNTLNEADRLAVAKARRMAPAQLSTLVRGDLDWIAMKAIEKKRTRRYDSAGALAADVKRHLSHEPVVARPPSAAYRLQKFSVRHRYALGAAAAVVVALGAGLGLSRMFERVRTGEAAVTPSALAAEPGAPSRSHGGARVQTVYSGKGPERNGLLSPDESMIAYIDWRKGAADLAVKSLATEATWKVTHAETTPGVFEYPYASVVWSPDSQWIAYGWSAGKEERKDLRLAPAAGGLLRVLKPHNPELNYVPLDWSADGKSLLCGLARRDHSRALVLVSVDTGAVRQLISVDWNQPGAFRHPRLSPDGRFIAFDRTVDDNQDIYLLSLAAQQIIRVTDSPTMDASPTSGDCCSLAAISAARGIYGQFA